jgi:GntR family transcriptional regulator
MIDKSSPVPIYYQLEEWIKKMIETKELQPGDALPSEREFSEKYQISRMTARQAINNLVQNGLLYRIQGKGTFVMERKIEKTLQGMTSFSEDMHSRGLAPRSTLLKFLIVPADPTVAAELLINEADPVFKINRIRLADNLPMAIEENYISVQLLPGLTEEVVNQSLYQYIHDTIPLQIQTAVQTIEASIADKREAEYLQIPEGSPILVISRIAKLEDGTPIERVKAVFRADRYKFITEINKATK